MVNCKNSASPWQLIGNRGSTEVQEWQGKLSNLFQIKIFGLII